MAGTGPAMTDSAEKSTRRNCHGRTTLSPSCPALCRASTSLLEAEKNVDGRDRAGHGGWGGKIDAKKLSRTHHPITVMPGLVPGIHVLAGGGEERGWPGQARP